MEAGEISLGRYALNMHYATYENSPADHEPDSIGFCLLYTPAGKSQMVEGWSHAIPIKPFPHFLSTVQKTMMALKASAHTISMSPQAYQPACAFCFSLPACPSLLNSSSSSFCLVVRLLGKVMRRCTIWSPRRPGSPCSSLLIPLPPIRSVSLCCAPAFTITSTGPSIVCTLQVMKASSECKLEQS